MMSFLAMKTNEEIADIFCQEEVLMALVLVIIEHPVPLIVFTADVCANFSKYQ